MITNKLIIEDTGNDFYNYKEKKLVREKGPWIVIIYDDGFKKNTGGELK